MLKNIEAEETEDRQDKDSVPEIDISTIHTVFAIQDGMFKKIEVTELKKKNYFYRVHSKVPGVAVIDYDKTNIVPIVKDILNRQNTFIEIKYLRWVIGLNIVLFIGLIIIGVVVGLNSPNFDTQKTEIILEIKKYGIQSLQQRQIIPTTPTVLTPSSTSPTTTPSPGYNPIFPEDTTPNNHKNTPSYAN